MQRGGTHASDIDGTRR